MKQGLHKIKGRAAGKRPAFLAFGIPPFETVRRTQTGANPMRFTADDAFEFRGTEDAIILDDRAARRILDQHSATVAEFAEDFPAANLAAIDAGDLLAFLGY